MDVRRIQAQQAIPVLMAVVLGVFLAVASQALDWSGTSTLVVGCTLVAVLALVGTPLMLLDLDRLEEAPRLENLKRLGDLAAEPGRRVFISHGDIDMLAEQLNMRRHENAEFQNTYVPLVRGSGSHGYRTWNQIRDVDSFVGMPARFAYVPGESGNLESIHEQATSPQRYRADEAVNLGLILHGKSHNLVSANDPALIGQLHA